MTSELTPYDTGERLEPKVWPVALPGTDEDYGKVDFDDDEDYTVATLHIERQGDGYLLRGYANEPLRVEIDDQSFDGQTLLIQPSAGLQAKVKETMDNLSTETERIESQVYWQQGQALILVGGETGYRKQQAIIVRPWGAYPVSSAIVKGWASGVRDTRI